MAAWLNRQAIRLRLKSLARFIGEHWPIILIGGIVILILAEWAAFAKRSGLVWADWTGFASYVDSDGKLHREKTLWDWMELLIIPSVLALGAFFFNRQERKNDLQISEDRRKSDLEIADNRNQEATIHNYFDSMTELILEKHLRETKSLREGLGGEDMRRAWTDAQLAARDMAQVRTVTVLRQLNSDRRNIVFQFLRDANLNSFILEGASLNNINLRQADIYKINMNEANLFQADLSRSLIRRANFKKAYLHRVNFSETNLNETDLSGADLFVANLIDANLSSATLCESDLCCARLSRANLSEAKLSKANLSGAVLVKANLSKADLSKSDLIMADLSEANLSGSDLSGADLSGAFINDDQLAQVKSLEGAIMPDGKQYDPAIHTFNKLTT